MPAQGKVLLEAKGEVMCMLCVYQLHEQSWASVEVHMCTCVSSFLVCCPVSQTHFRFQIPA